MCVPMAIYGDALTGFSEVSVNNQAWRMRCGPIPPAKFTQPAAIVLFLEIFTPCVSQKTTRASHPSLKRVSWGSMKGSADLKA
jgi:hypothetical protein